MAKTVVKKGKKYWVMKNMYGKSVLVPTFRIKTPSWQLSQLGCKIQFGATPKRVLANCVPMKFLGHSVPIHRKVYAQFKAVERDILAYEKKHKVHYTVRLISTYSWRPIKKLVRGRIVFGRTLSKHSWAIAMDINWDTNGLGASKHDMPRYFISSFKAHGLEWGGDWSVRDYMHHNA